MIKYTLIAAGSYSITLAVMIGLIRLPRLHRSYQPFIILTVSSLVNETISHMFILHKKSNALAINIFGFFDAILWLWQFRKWNKNYKHQAILYATTIILMLVWIIENVVFKKIFTFGSIHAIAISLSAVIFSIAELGRQITHEKINPLTSSKFLICCGAVLFYSYRILVECFFAPGSYKSEIFFGNVFIILSLVNIIVNLLFALAVIWIPEKKKFSLPYY